MNRRVTKNILLFLLLLLLAVGAASACRREQRLAPEEKKDSIPSPLMGIVENSQTIIEQMEKLQQEMEKPVQQPSQQQEGQGSQGGQSDGGGQESGGEGEGQQGGQSQPDPQQQKKQQLDKMWEETLKTVEDTHKLWNNYETTAVKDKARDQSMFRFERALNALTVAVNQKDMASTTEQANTMGLTSADFLDLYKNNPNAQITRVRYYLQQCCIDARQNDWAGAEQRVWSAKREAEELEQEVELEESDKGLMDKLNLSIDNIDSAMDSRDLDLLKIKKDIALENLKELEEKSK